MCSYIIGLFFYMYTSNHILYEQSYKGKVKTHNYINRPISQQPENCDLVQAFLKKWWVESDFKAPNLPLSLLLKGSGCHYNSIYNNLIYPPELEVKETTDSASSASFFSAETMINDAFSYSENV
jgi:hypothetical protein